jgi:hypothetical protein
MRLKLNLLRSKSRSECEVLHYRSCPLRNIALQSVHILYSYHIHLKISMSKMKTRTQFTHLAKGTKDYNFEVHQVLEALPEMNTCRAVCGLCTRFLASKFLSHDTLIGSPKLFFILLKPPTQILAQNWQAGRYALPQSVKPPTSVKPPICTYDQETQNSNRDIVLHK